MKSVSPAESSEDEKVGSSEPRTKAQVVREMEEQYNAMARVWNGLPGERLIYPQDKFRIKECFCDKGKQVPIREKDRYSLPVKYPYCELCGYALPGAYKD